MNEVLSAAGVPTSLSSPPPLVCRLRPREVVGRQGPVPNMGEVELENRSDAPLEIEYTLTPLQYLELVVIAPGGEVISEGHFSDRFSPTLEPAVLRLQPGEKFTAKVSLLATVPREKRVPGTYTVQASYCFRGAPILAEPLTVELGGA
jgi:hypothetical protein